MDNLLDLARKFDATHSPEIREKLRAAVENSTNLEPADQATVDEVLALGDRIKTQLGERCGEFEDRFTKLIERCKDYPWPAESAVRLSDAAKASGHEIVSAIDAGRRLTLFDCGCAYDVLAPIAQCADHEVIHRHQSAGGGLTWHQIAILDHDMDKADVATSVSESAS